MAKANNNSLAICLGIVFLCLLTFIPITKNAWTQDKADIPNLMEALKDKDDIVSLKAAWTLGKIGSAAVPGLIEALKDKNVKWGTLVLRVHCD